MGQRRHHYEVAFEARLRAGRAPYVSVNEVRRSVLPGGAAPAVLTAALDDAGGGANTPRRLKSFDFVIYGRASNLLVEVKGRKIPRRVLASAGRATKDATLPLGPAHAAQGAARSRLDSWVTAEDVEALSVWEALFGPGFEGVFAFIYWCDEQPPDALFEEIIEHRGRWYALRAIRLRDYRRHMRVRSPKWGTVHLPTRDFDRLSVAFAPTHEAPEPDAWLGSATPEHALEPLG